MTAISDLCVKTRTYEKDGAKKNVYKKIGEVHEGANGKYIVLDASVNLAAFPRKENDDRVMVSIFDVNKKIEKQSDPAESTNPDDLPF
jgi:hypothetical protein